MPVFVKVTAYEYAVYGGLDGTVEYIGPDTITALQEHLKNRGHDLEVDGVAGYRTVECLQYELANGTLWD